MRPKEEVPDLQSRCSQLVGKRLAGGGDVIGSVASACCLARLQLLIFNNPDACAAPVATSKLIMPLQPAGDGPLSHAPLRRRCDLT
jgi:hypothetical protein